MKKLFSKLLVILLVIYLAFAPLGRVLALDAPTPPAPPSAPTAPTAPEPPKSPEPPKAPEPPAEPTAPSTPTDSVSSSKEQDPAEQKSPPPDQSADTVSQPALDGGNQTGSQQSDGNAGDTTINTGDATNNAGVSTVGNSNLAVSPASGDGVSVANSGNGADSGGSGSATTNNTNTLLQGNGAYVGNGLDQTTVTGQNSASKNVGNSAITTGDANTSGTIISAVNTNVSGVAVSEFNVVDNHIGDIILDFGAGCVSGCGGGNSGTSNTGNGANSDNLATTNQDTANNTFQNNDATVANNMLLSSDSGTNKADKNTAGDSTITTGDANISASVLTMANNNFAGNVVYGVVNIYGDLVGDIVFPEEQLSACCQNQTTVSNTGNGSGSNNTASSTQTTTNTLSQNNLANIENNLDQTAVSGANQVNSNTGGDSSVTTGDTSVKAQVLNVANTNVDNGSVWLVLINQAGQWLGRIIGGTGGDNFAGSAGTEFAVSPSGEITAVNSGNGGNSVNTANTTTNTTNTLVQTNTTNVVNNIKLFANTGGNSASYNTGGDSSITTGDATIIASVVNFVNNNIAGNGKLFVTVVNVFGSWLGDFITPGAKKGVAVSQNSSQPPPIGGNPGSAVQSPAAPAQSSGSSNDSPAPATQQQTPPSLTPTIPGNSGNSLSVAPSIRVLAGGSSQGDGSLAASGKKILRINLAYLILLLPLAILYLARKRLAQVYTALLSFLL